MFESVKAFLRAPKRHDEMSDGELRAVVDEVSLFFAAGCYRRKNPRAGDVEALAFAQANKRHFADAAIDWVILVSETRARRSQAASN